MNDLLKTYTIGSERIESTTKTEVSGLIITIPHSERDKGVTFWVTFEEVAPVSAVGPEPQKKWRRVRTLRFNSSNWDCQKWSCEISEPEFDALKHVVSKANTTVRDAVLKEIVKNKIIPWTGLPNELRSRQTEYVVRSATLCAVFFNLKTEIRRGANLMGVTIYVDQNDRVLFRANDITHAD
jgi:hypothetical protein